MSELKNDSGAVSDLVDIFDDLLGPFNLIDRTQGLLAAIRHGNYREAAEHGPLGIAGEILSSAVGANTHRFAMLRSGDHSLNEVEALLRTYGVPIFGRTHDARCMYFSVKRRQARWAEYLMLQSGVRLDSVTFDHRNPGYVGLHAPGWMPAPWSGQPTFRPDAESAQPASRRPATAASGTRPRDANPPASNEANASGSWLERFDNFFSRLSGDL